MLTRHDRRHRPVFKLRQIVEAARHAQPVHMRRAPIDGRAEVGEAMEKAVADPAPILEFDADLEGGAGLADEIGAVEPERKL
jgi:hypothetical protein